MEMLGIDAHYQNGKWAILFPIINGMEVARVRDIWKVALPAGSRLAAGADGLDREVEWMCVIRSYPPLPDDVSAGDFALLAPVPQILTEDTQVALVRDLAGVGVAAVGVIGDVPGAVVNLADEGNLPVLSIPIGARLGDVERAVAAFISNRQAEMEKRGVQIYRQMAQMVTAGRGIGAIIDQLAQITGKTVALQDYDFKVRFYAGPLVEGLSADQMREMLRDGRQLQAWLDGVPLVSTAPPIGQFDLPAPGLSRFVAPVVVRESILGYVSVLGLRQDLTELDRVATGRAASVCAIELAKERAVVEAENKVRGDFLEDLLAGNFLTEEAVVRRGALLGYDLTVPYSVVVVKLDVSTCPERAKELAAADTRSASADASAEALRAEAPSPSLRSGSGSGSGSGQALKAEGLLGQLVRLELPRRSPRALLHVSKDTATLLWPMVDGDVNRLKESVDNLRQYLAAAADASISAGVSRVSVGARDLPRAHREANQAVSVAQNLLGGGRTAYIDDLLVYRLLFPLQGSRELAGFYEETIGRLVAHDQRHSSELVKTLATFFSTHGNINRTAERLFLHRNAVAYRLKRIERISGLSLDDPEHRLALQLGLKVRDIV